jgi:DNA-binding NarL/FixJ family response regulator
MPGHFETRLSKSVRYYEIPTTSNQDISSRKEAVEPFPSLEELSCQERRLVALFCQEYSVKEAARELVISPDTVKTYARRIYAKLGVKSKAGCVAVAYHRLMLK